jgi:CRISPR-associated protein Cmr4
MKPNLAYLYLLSPLHTGGTSQEGNLVGIARETHTELPYLPSSTIRGRLRAATAPKERQIKLWGNTLDDVTSGDNLTQGNLWVGDGAILWFPVPSLSHGVVWITSQFLLKRWLRLTNKNLSIPEPGSFSKGNKSNLFLKDAVFHAQELNLWTDWKQYIPDGNNETKTIKKVLVMKEEDCQILIQSSLWRQVKVNLNEEKSVVGGFRYEEAIPPETLMYFPWDKTVAANGNASESVDSLKAILNGTEKSAWQFGGQESLGRGLTELWTN